MIKKREDKGKIPAKSYSNFFTGADFAEKPCFCFQYIHRNYNSGICDERRLKDLVNTLEKLSQLTWLQIESSQRHGLGAEKIDLNAIKPGIPGNVPKGITLLAIRFSGKCPMIGFRERNVFHILFLDPKFEVYNHS
jgi:hypothetical protein